MRAETLYQGWLTNRLQQILWTSVDETKTVLNNGDDKALDVLALDALGCRDMGDGLAITTIESESNARLLFVFAADFKPI